MLTFHASATFTRSRRRRYVFFSGLGVAAFEVGATTPTMTFAESASPETSEASARSTVETVLFAVTTGFSCASVEAYSVRKAPVEASRTRFGVGVEARGVHGHEVHGDLPAGGQRCGAVVGLPLLQPGRATQGGRHRDGTRRAAAR